MPAVAIACADDVTQRWLPLPRPYDEEMAVSWCTGIAENLRVTGDGIPGARVDPSGGADGRVDLRIYSLIRSDI